MTTTDPASQAAMRPAAISQRQAGFTLVELLVVVLILGLLAAIAIPVFVGQRRKAVDTMIKSDLRTAAVGFEAHRNEGSGYPTSAAVLTDIVALSPGVSIAAHRTDDTFCLVGVRTSGVQPTHAWVYTSADGLQDASVTTCTGPVAFTLS